MIKRGQVTLFMIIGVVVIFSIGLATYFITLSQSQKLKPSINLEQKKLSMANYIQSCFSDKVKEARNRYGLDEIKMERYVDENICKDFSEFEEEGLSITFTESHTDVTINQDVIFASMKYLIMMRLGLSSQSLEEFSFNMAVTTKTHIPTQNGVASEDTVLKSGDGLLELFVAKGTSIKDDNGNPVEYPEVVVELSEVPPNPTTYGLGIYEVEPHLSFSQPITLRLRYYDLHLGKEENLKVIKRPAPQYLWRVVPDQDPPYTASNLMIARLTDLSQIALTATCGSGEESSIYFYTNYVYIQNCEPCKCFKEDASAEHPLYLDDTVFGECSDQNKISPGKNEEKLEEKTYEQKTLFDEPRGGTSGYKNIDGCKEEENTLFYDAIEAVGGTGEFDLGFEVEENSCIHEIVLEKEDVDDRVSLISMDSTSFGSWKDLFEQIVSDVKKEDSSYSKTITVGVDNKEEGEWDACSHERLLIKVSGTGIGCSLPSESIAKCCTQDNKEECDWEEVGIAGCNKLGFHTLVQETNDQNLINKHLEVAHGFSGDNGWVLNTIWTPQAFNPDAYVSEATRLKLRPIIRLDVNYEKPGMQHIDGFVNLVNSIPELHYVQFLNEPNIAWDAWGEALKPEEYVDMLLEFKKRVGDKVYIIAGNLAPTDAGAPHISTEEYINQLFGEGNSKREEFVKAFDIWGSHSYPADWSAAPPEHCEGAGCPMNSVYGYKWELAKIKQSYPDFDKNVIITETGYDVTKLDQNTIAQYMETIYKEWDADPVLIGVTPFILAPIGDQWVSHRWASIPNAPPYEPVELTPFFERVRDMDHSGAKCEYKDIDMNGEDEEEQELDVPWIGEERPPGDIFTGIKLFSAPASEENYYWKLKSVEYLGNAGGRYTIRVYAADENTQPSITPTAQGCDGPYYKPDPDNFWEFQCDVQTGISTMAREVYVKGFPSEKISGLLAGNENTHCGYYLTFQKTSK